MRISIIGQPASGKTILAEDISKKLSIPQIHLDRFWLEAGGRNNSRSTKNPGAVHAHMREKTLIEVEQVSWVSDGFYSRIQPEIARHADMVIFLDIPLWRRLLNHVGRLFKPSEKHSELSTWDEFTFFFEILHREFRNNEKFERFLSEYRDKTRILKSRENIKQFLDSLQTHAQPTLDLQLRCALPKLSSVGGTTAPFPSPSAKNRDTFSHYAVSPCL